MKTSYRIALLALVAFCCAGCGRQQPIVKGKPVSGLIWEFPRSKPTNNTGNPIDRDSVVSVYPTLIVVEASDGTKEIVPLEQVSDLKLK